MARPVSFIFRDSKGQTARTKLWLATTAANFEPQVASLVTLFQALTNANVTSSIDNAAPVVYGTTAVYETVEDKGILTFQGATNGGLHRFSVPAPKAITAGGALFLADGETVDPSNAEFIALKAVLISVSVVARTGEQLTYVGGFRARRKLQRRMNVFTLSPTLTAGEPAE